MEEYLETLIKDLSLIDTINVSYTTSRHMGYTDQEAENRAYKALIRAIEIVGEIDMLYNAYGLEDDEDLTADAQELKQIVLRFIDTLRNGLYI